MQANCSDLPRLRNGRYVQRFLKGDSVMASEQHKFNKGDWIVHPVYGVGRIKKLEKKRLDGQRQEYYRVEAGETAYWIPLVGIEESRARKVISQADFRKAVQLLEKPPKTMDANYKVRRKRINDVLTHGLLNPTIRLVRDLWARNRKNRLNDSEKNALRRIMDNLVDEWAITEGISTEEASIQLNEMLDHYQVEEPKAQKLSPLGRLKKKG